MLRTVLQYFRSVCLKNVYFVSDVFNFIFNDVKGFSKFLLIVNVDLNEQIPFFLLGCEMDGLIPGSFVFATDVNCCSHVKNAGMLGVFRGGGLNVCFDFVELFFLYIAIQKQCGVVFVVVCY